MYILANTSIKATYYLVLVLSTKEYVIPFPRVGGKDSPLTTVLSVPVCLPRGSSISYCPENKASSPGFNFLTI